MNRSVSLAWVIVGPVVAWTLLAATGCGDSLYHERLTKSLEQLRKFGPFTEFLQPAKTEALGISIRLPKSINERAKPYGGDGPEASFLKQQGFLFGYLMESADGAGGVPSMVVMFFEGPPAGLKPEAYLSAKATMTKMMVKDSNPAYSETSVFGSDGQNRTFQMMSVAGQPAVGPMNSPAVRVDSYAYVAGEKVILVEWMAQTAVAEQNQFFEAARYAMGTFSYTPPAPMTPEGAPPMDGAAPAAAPMGAAPMNPR